jgi:hypothetical protein
MDGTWQFAPLRPGKRIEDRILPIDRAIAEEWGRMSGTGVDLLDPFAC